MKINSISSKNIYGNSTPYTYKNNSKMNINSSSPIKVRKKFPSLIKVNSLESFKIFKTTNHSKKKLIRPKETNFNFDIFIKRTLLKHNSKPFLFYIKIANQLLFNFPNHLVSKFKDYLIWNENYDYIKNMNCLKKSIELLPKIGNYYQTYTLFIPNYFPLRNLILSKYIKNKIKLFENSENEQDLKDEIKDIDKNIIENNTKKKNVEINDEKKEDELTSKEKIDKKLINTTEIKTENSCSLSNYFGLDSVIKFKDNSNFGENNNFENQLINYSLLNKIKNNYKNEDNKTNLDYSLELAAIIQSFEENERNYYKNIKPKIKSCNTKKSKCFTKEKSLVRTNKYNTNTNFYKKKYELKNKNNKKYKNNKNNSLKPKYNHIDNGSKIKSKNFSLPKNGNIIRLNLENKLKYKILLKNKLRNKSNDLYNKNNLTINNEKFNNIFNKFQNETINTENNSKNIYHTYVSNKTNKNKICGLLHKNIKTALTTTKKRIKIEPKKLIYKKIITNSQDSMYFKIIKNKRSKSIDRKENTPNKIYKRNNLSLNITNETKFYKTNEFIKIKISSSNIKKNINVSRNIYNNICRSQRQRHCLKNDFSNINLKKIIFVNKKKENNNINEKNHVKHNNTLNLSYKDLSSININNPMNKIFVNKKENLSKTIKKKINKKNNASKLDIEKINNLEVKNSLNDYKKLLETEYNTFIPRTIIKKMFFNKLNCESKSNNEHKKYSPIKKRDISIKNNQNACSNGGANITKTNSNNNKKLEIKIPRTCSINKDTYKNIKALTEFNKLVEKFPKYEISSPSKSSREKKIKNVIKIKKISIHTKTPCLKKTSYFMNKSNNDKIRNNIFNKALKEIKSLKINKNLKKSFVSKSKFMINVNIYNNYKINQEISNDKVKRKDILENDSKPQYINKNKIHNLIQNNSINYQNKEKHKKTYKIIRTIPNIIKNTYSIESKGLSKSAKSKNIKKK